MQDGTRLRFGVRSSRGVEEFFAKNAATGQEVPINEQPERKTASGLTVKLNQFRKLRPGQPLLKPGRCPDIILDPRECKFGCMNAGTPNSLLQRPLLLRMKGARKDYAVLPQLAPLEPAHVLIVPCEGHDPLRFPHADQLLDDSIVNDLIDSAVNSPGWVILYNSLHAGATVRHLHLQAVEFQQPLPIETAQTAEQQGWRLIDDPRFPGGGLQFNHTERTALMRAIVVLQSGGFPLNLLARGQKVFLFPRDPNNEIVDVFPYSGFASMEMAGIIYTSSKEAFDRATDSNVNAVLARTALEPRELLKLLAATAVS